MTPEYSDSLKGALEIAQSELESYLAEHGLILSQTKIDNTEALLLFAGSEYKLVIGIDFHDHSLVIYFLPASADLEKGLLLRNGVVLGQVIADSHSPDSRQELKAVNRSLDPYDEKDVKAFLRAVRPIVVKYLQAGRKAVIELNS